MAGLLDMLLSKGEYMDPNKVLDRRMAQAGIPNAPRLPPGQIAPQQVQGQVQGNNDAFTNNVMNEIRRRRQARAQAAAAAQNGGGQLF